MPYQEKQLQSFARGDDWTIRLTIKDSAGTAINITGRTYWLTLKSDSAEADPGDTQVSVVAGGADATNGIVDITTPKAQTDLLTPGTYKYDVQEVDGSGVVSTLLLGKVRVATDITRSTS